MKIHSGYKTITPIQFANALWAMDQGRIQHRSLRVYWACFVLVAVREAAKRWRLLRREKPKDFSRYQVCELQRLTGLGSPQTKRALKDLAQAGLLAFSETELVITKDTLPGSEGLQEQLAGGRSPGRPIPVPRSMLRFLAQNRAETLTKVVLAYLLRGLSIARGTAAICPKGTVKASWIAQRLHLSRRAVKYAQATLRQLGWISKDTQSHQRKLNRDGAYFSINLAWTFRTQAKDSTPVSRVSRVEPHEGASSAFVHRHKNPPNFAPPSRQNVSSFAPPIKNQETSNEENKDQKAQATEPQVLGVCVRRVGETHPATTPGLPPPSLNRIVPEDLCRFDRLEQLYFQAAKRRWIDPCEAMALNFVAAAVRSRQVARDPVKVFVAIVRKGLWHHITQAQEDRARCALLRFRNEDFERFRPRGPENTGPSNFDAFAS